MESTHHFEDHVGEIGVVLAAPSEAELLAEAGRALAEVMVGRLPAAAPESAPVEIELAAHDLPALLADWLNELIYRSEMQTAVFTRFEVRLTGASALVAKAWGVRPARLKTQVKAATLHEIRFERTADGWSGHVVLDV